jgi:type IV pilus assembly protein PilB
MQKVEEIPPEALLEAGFSEEEIDGTWQCYGRRMRQLLRHRLQRPVGIYEVMPITDDMRQNHHAKRTALDIAEQARKTA